MRATEQLDVEDIADIEVDDIEVDETEMDAWDIEFDATEVDRWDIVVEGIGRHPWDRFASCRSSATAVSRAISRACMTSSHRLN